MLISQMPPPCRSVTDDLFSSLYSGVILAMGSTTRLPLIVVRPRGCRPEISANCGFFGPVVTKARKETLAGKRCGETSESVEIGQLRRLLLPKEIVPGGGGNVSSLDFALSFILACIFVLSLQASVLREILMSEVFTAIPHAWFTSIVKFTPSAYQTQLLPGCRRDS